MMMTMITGLKTGSQKVGSFEVSELTVKLHGLSLGVAALATYWWLAEIVPSQLNSAEPPGTLKVIAGWGRHRAEWTVFCMNLAFPSSSSIILV